jgi:hypothetical protein
MDRRAFLRTSASATTLLLAGPTWYAARSEVPDAAILSQAREGIARHRQGRGRILVRNGSGKPMPGVKITVQQLRHDFLFGCNFFLGRCGDPETEEHYRAHFAALFNYATLGFYWAAYERERGKPDYDYTQEVTGWTQEQAITGQSRRSRGGRPRGEFLYGKI